VVYKITSRIPSSEQSQLISLIELEAAQDVIQQRPTVLVKTTIAEAHIVGEQVDTSISDKLLITFLILVLLVSYLLFQPC
jgi:hypothetical protein